MKQQKGKLNNTILSKYYNDSAEKEQPSSNEFNALNFYLFSVYSSPFMPGIDLSFAVDEVMKLIKNWNKK